MKFRIFIAIGFLIILNACSTVSIKEEISSGQIDPDDPNIQYSGRFDERNPKKVIFDWPGVSIKAKFEGTSCSIILNDNKNEYAVVVDNRAPRIFTPDTSNVHKVVSGLDDKVPHTILIQKRTEALVGKGIFSGFILDKGKKLLPLDKLPERKIEFIGNSITCGYGDEGESVNCHFSPQTENANMSYASITARALNADYSLVAYSGRGIVRNYGDPNKVSKDPMPVLYKRTCYYDSTFNWDFKKWIPQVVVINLGTNDFSTKPFPDKDVFQAAYLKLINTVRSNYQGVTIFCICGPMIQEPCLSYISEVVNSEQRKQRDKDLFLIEIKRNYLAESDWGCDLHPNINGMNKMTDIIVPYIKLRMNW